MSRGGLAITGGSGPGIGALMDNADCLSNLLQVCTRKTEEFVRTLDSKYMVWLTEIEEEARKMFSSDFTAEPELMPKTPSQKRRRKKRISIVPDENRDPNARRISRRKSNASWSTSVRRLSMKFQDKPGDTSIQDIHDQPRRVTRAKANLVCPPVPEKPVMESPELPGSRVLQVKITADDRRSAELQLTEHITADSARDVTEPPAPEIAEPQVAVTTEQRPAPVTPETKNRGVGKLRVAESSTPKRTADHTEVISVASPEPVAAPVDELPLDLSDACSTPTGSRSDRRSVRRSLVRQSNSRRASLVSKYSLASKRESMTREAVRKSIRRSVSKKKAGETSSSSSIRSYQSSIEIVDEEVTIKIRPETEQSAPAEEVPAPESPRRSLRSRGFKKIAISNLSESDQPQRRVTRQSVALGKETGADGNDDAQIGRRKSYKRAVDELSEDEQPMEMEVQSPPRKKTPSPPCPPSKVVKPLPHMKTFLHTVQKNQLLMMTPGSVGRSVMKSFIKRNTPLKPDPKEKERQRLEALRKKEEAELQRKMKIEEGKKRKQEELKMRREERLRKVLQARERVEQLEEEKKKKIEQKFAQNDEKNEKVKEDRMAEEKAKKKFTAKKQEDFENRRRQEEDMRKVKVRQMEEEERKHQELMQKKREEEEQERQRKMAEARRLAEQEREKQLAAEKEQERIRAEREKERIEKEKALQLQKELELAAQEKLRREAEERKKKEMQERLEQERQERLHKEQEAKRLREEQEKKAKEQQAAATNAPALNVTVDIANSPACESYEMTPKGYKAHSMKVNPEDYGMDLNSDDSTDDESQPRKPIPAWATGNQLAQAIRHQYYNPIDVDRLYGTIDSPKLEDMFYKNKPRYFKRTSSAVWHSPPMHSSSSRQHLAVGYGLKKY